LCKLRQTLDVKIGSDSYFARAWHSEVRITGLPDMTLEKEVPVSQQVWHIKEPSLLKSVSVERRSKFAALSPVMVADAR
jgi:hypothetical protein